MKKGTKLLSVLLAFVMVISMFAATFAASAADYYKPHYTEEVTEEDVSLMLGDVNTLLSRELLTGDIIEEIYKFLPSLSAVVNNGSPSDSTRNAAYYKAAQPERFAALPDGEIVDDVTDENGNVTTPGTFTTFFETHPIVCSDLAAFQTEINNIIDLVVIDNVMSTIVFAFVFFGQQNIPQGQALGDGVDQICEALGVEQEAKLQDLLGIGAQLGSFDTAGTRVYLKNVVSGLLPDLSNNLMAIIRSIADEEKGAKLYAGITAVLENLSSVLTALSSSLASLGVDLESVLTTIDELKNGFAALPTLGEGDTKRLDLEGVIGRLVPLLTNSLVGIELKIVFVDREEHDPEPPTLTDLPGSDLGGLENGIQFRHMQLDRIANCESTADVMKTIYDYLYDNLIADPTNNALLTSVVGLAGLVGIPQAIADFLDAALDMDNSELANELILMLANEAGRHVLTAYAATAPTCTVDGNTAYYVCEACGKWFADADATQEITDQNSVIVPATGHTPAEHYYADPDGHALICETCGVTLESGAHVDEDGDGLCDVCAFEIPAEPEEPTEPEQPTDPEQPTQPEEPTEPTTGADDETPVKDADIPKTGSAASIGFGALSLAAAGALVLLRVRSKKNDII